MSNIYYRCTNIGNCSKSDSQERILLATGVDAVCPECGSSLMAISSANKNHILPILLAISGIFALAASSLWFFDSYLNSSDAVTPVTPPAQVEADPSITAEKPQTELNANQREILAQAQRELEAERKAQEDTERSLNAEKLAQAQRELAAERQARKDAEQRLDKEKLARAQRALKIERKARDDAEQKLAADRLAQEARRILDEAQKNQQNSPSPPEADPELQGAEETVKNYYSALNERNCSIALSMHGNPPNNLCQQVLNIEQSYVVSSSAHMNYPYNATVDVDVIVKKRHAKPERWKGNIDLSKIDGTWKIMSMKKTLKRIK